MHFGPLENGNWKALVDEGGTWPLIPPLAPKKILINKTEKGWNKIIKFWNFGQILLEPPEKENLRVSLAKWGTFPQTPPPFPKKKKNRKRQKKITIF